MNRDSQFVNYLSRSRELKKNQNTEQPADRRELDHQATGEVPGAHSLMETSNARTGQDSAECGPVPVCGVCTDALGEAVRKGVGSREDLPSKALCFVYSEPCSGPPQMELHAILPQSQAE